MSLWSRVTGVGPSGFGYGSTAEEVVQDLDLTDRSFVVTGVTSGIGAETGRVLLQKGARVFGLGRSRDAIIMALGGPAPKLIPIQADLVDLESLKAAASEICAQGPVDAIIDNAGIMALPKLELVHGYERQFFTNHVAHFALTRLCLDALTDHGRIVMVSSEAHRAAPREGIDFDNLRGERRYRAWTAYGRSKLANILFAFELGRRLREPTMMAHAVHPGVIHTQLARYMSPIVDLAYKLATPLALKSIPEGAATQVYVATHPKVPAFPSTYFKDANPGTARGSAYSTRLALRLWEETERILEELGVELPRLPRRESVSQGPSSRP